MKSDEAIQRAQDEAVANNRKKKDLDFEHFIEAKFKVWKMSHTSILQG